MKVETIGNATLYLGNCLEIMPTLPKVDIVMTDPPYGVLEEEWDDMSMRDLSRLTMAWLSSASLLSDTVMTFFAQKTRHIIEPLLQSLFEENRQMIWNKQGGRVAEDGMFYSYELIYFCHPTRTWTVCEPKAMQVAKLITAAREAAGLSRGAVDMVVRGKKTGLCYRWEEAACLPTIEQVAALRGVLRLGANFDMAYEAAQNSRDEVIAKAREITAANAGKTCDVFSVAPTTSAGRHPTEKPIRLMDSLVGVLTEKDDLVLDCFMGSGTTGVSCVNLGRRFIGIEREPKYFQMACERVAAAQAQQRLFA